MLAGKADPLPPRPEDRADCERFLENARERMIARHGEWARDNLARAARLGAVSYRRWRMTHGGTARQAARELGVSERTLSNWDLRERRDGLKSRPRGRPRKPVSAQERRAVLRFIQRAGLAVGVLRLKREFPAVTREALEEILKEERTSSRGRNGRGANASNGRRQ